MKKENRKLYVGLCLLAVFGIWTVLVSAVDVQAIGPRNSTVGFATINDWFHGLTGVHMSLYTVTDWLGLVPVAVAFGFAVLGLVQWMRRKSICKVDGSLLILGVFYLLVMAAYILFELVVINRRPVLIEGYLEASYPSSTTLLVACIMPTAMMQLRERIENRLLRTCIARAIAVFIALMIVGRLFSGVHWITDIIGGLLLSAGLVSIYDWAINKIK